MAIAIILIYDEGRHLVHKPADYKSLIAVARAKFPALVGVANNNIAFHFTPEWFDAEVQIDDGAFSEVHDRAVLRVTTTGSDPAQGPSHSSIKQEDGSSLPSRNYMIPIMVHYTRRGFGGWDRYRYEVDPDDTLVVALGHDVSSRFGVGAHDLVFKFGGREFDAYITTANDLGIQPEDTVDVVFVGRGRQR